MKNLLSCLLVAGCLSVSGLAHADVAGAELPGKWESAVPGTGPTVSWSLMDSGLSCQAEFVGCVTASLASFMPSAYLGEIQAAFNAWSAVANISFVQVVDNGQPFFAAGGTMGDIRLAGHSFAAGSTLAHAYYPVSGNGTAAGDVHFNTGRNWTIGFSGSGFSIFQVAAHEIGHAIGLEHSSVANSLMNPTYSTAFLGPQADDIAKIQAVYGVALIPEPASVVLLALGVVALLLRRRAPLG